MLFVKHPRLLAALVATSALAVPAAAQEVRPSTVAEAPAGEVGQRQTREDAAPNVEPMGRIANRIQNRLQNRVRNRIDRNYDPQANATSPFRVADEQTRRAGRDPR